MPLRYDHRHTPAVERGELAEAPPMSKLTRQQRMRVRRAWVHCEAGKLNRVQWALITLDATVRILKQIPAHGYDHLLGMEVEFVSGIYWPIIAMNGSIFAQVATDEHSATWGPLMDAHGLVLGFLRDNEHYDDAEDSTLRWRPALIEKLREADQINSWLSWFDPIERALSPAMTRVPTVAKIGGAVATSLLTFLLGMCAGSKQ